MGILDLFKKKSPSGPAPRVGKIEQYNVADNVGSVRLETGDLLRFGRSACQAFEPAEGVHVLVHSSGPHPLGGERVQTMTRDPRDASYEQKVAARDSKAPPPPPKPASAPLPRHPVNPDVLKRFGNVAAANTLVRGGQDPERLLLAINLDADGKVDGDRPTMKFRFDIQRPDVDRWRFDARVDDAVAQCRFTMDIDLPELPLLDAGTFDMNNAPGFRMTVSKAVDVERNPMARMAFLQHWRVDGGMDSPNLSDPLVVDVTVMGVELTRLDYAYVPAQEPTEHWVLLKCHRGEQSIWLSLDLSTGSGEIFPRRGEVESYKLALDVLCTFT